MRRRSNEFDGSASDEALIAGMALGDERAGLAFVRRYQRRLFGLALTIVGDPGVAEDVAQEAFLRVFRHAPIFDPRRGSVATWVLTITRHLAIDALRIRRPMPMDPADTALYALVSLEGGPEHRAIHADAMARVRAVLAQVPEEQRRAVVLATIFGRTAMEIADLENVPLGTAKSRLRVGMMKLREASARSEWS